MTNHLLFPRLFERASIGELKFRNRIVMLPMGTAYATPSGEVTQRTIDYYVERARGGVGLITVGNISPYRPNALNQLVLDSDWVLMGQYELVEKVHAEGAKITAQLNYPGRQKYPEARFGEQLVSSSPLATTFLGEVYPPARALSKGEIYQFIERYARSAERAKQVGYDMVELHGAHGYLINQFISPFMNKRMDDFGGSLENRMRFPLELIKEVRQAVGPKFPIGIRISAVEFVPRGITLEESPTMARMLEAAGVAYISVSAGIFETVNKFADLMHDPEGWKEYIWEAIKKAVKVPIIAGGGLRHPDFCERLLERGKADFIGLARPLLADPEWPRKAKEKRIEDIRLCISCNECAFGSSVRRRGGGARRCTVNAATGREREFSKEIPAIELKRIMVIGGGPAGMEAARVAAVRGHTVFLYEKRAELGGQLLIASILQSKRKLLWLRDYLAIQLKKLNVKVEVGVKVTRRLVQEVRPDTIVVATGAEPVGPDIPGIGSGMVVNAWELLQDNAKHENKMVVVVGGGMVGCEVAEYLVERRNKVTIVEQLPSLASDMEPSHRCALLDLFEEKSVDKLTSQKVVGMNERGVQVVNLESGQEEFLEASLVVIAMGARPVDMLIDALVGKFPELYSVGDCNQVRGIMEAVYEGSLVGRQI